MLKHLSEAGKKIARRNVERLKTLKATIEAMIAEVDVEEVTESAQALAEAVLRQADSLDKRRDQVRTAIRDALKLRHQDPMNPDKYVYVWVRDLFPGAAVYERSDEGEYSLWQVPYSVDSTSGTDQVILGEPFEVEVAYVPRAQVAEVTESASLDLGIVPLVEKAIRRDGTIALKLADPGWGTSGYYSKEVLKRDGPKVFTAGTKMFANHYTAAEEAERPEGKIEDLAAVLTSAARWEDAGPDGPGLYADAKVKEAWKASIEDLAGDIGVSIRALGRAKMGEAEGRQGPIVESIVHSKSIDFVTDAGRGGKILSLREAANQRQQGGAPPASSATEEEKDMPLSEAEQKQLHDITESNKNLTSTVQRLLQEGLRRDARDVVKDLIPQAMPATARARLVESLTVNPPTKDGVLDPAALAEATKTAVQKEAEYIRSLGGGVEITGLGESAGGEAGAGEETVSLEESTKQLEAALIEAGLSESTAKLAAKGRA